MSEMDIGYTVKEAMKAFLDSIETIGDITEPPNVTWVESKNDKIFFQINVTFTPRNK